MARPRLDKVVVAPDGGNRRNTNRPTTDNEIGLIWGISSEMVGVVSTAKCHWTPRYRDDRSSWNMDRGVIHELNYARYLVDLYGFNFGAHRTSTAASLGPDEAPAGDDWPSEHTIAARFLQSPRQGGKFLDRYVDAVRR